MKTKATEAEAKKHKMAESSQPPPKKLKTDTKTSRSSKSSNSSKKAQVPHAPASTTEPIFITTISMAPPAADNTERQIVLHESASKETRSKQHEDIAAKDVEKEPGVVPQLENVVVSSPLHEVSENMDIEDPSTPLIPDEFWEQEHPNSPQGKVLPQTPPLEISTPVINMPESPLQDIEVDEVNVRLPMKRLHKGPRPSFSMASIPEENAFAQANPTATAEENEPVDDDNSPVHEEHERTADRDEAPVSASITKESTQDTVMAHDSITGTTSARRWPWF